VITVDVESAGEDSVGSEHGEGLTPTAAEAEELEA
jgi:hypothetical protein